MTRFPSLTDAAAENLSAGDAVAFEGFSAKHVSITLAQSRRATARRLDFVTSFEQGAGGDARRTLGTRPRGPTLVITDLAIQKPDPETKAFQVVPIHPGATRAMVDESCACDRTYAPDVAETAPPAPEELDDRRGLLARTALATEGRGR